MKPYAERPGHLTAQLAADLLALAWLAGGIWLASEVRELVLRLRGPGEQLVSAGSGLSGAFTDAAGTARRVPLVGDELAGALGGAPGRGNRSPERAGSRSRRSPSWRQEPLGS